MRPSIKDQIEGALHELKGSVIEVTGQVLDKPELEADGLKEKIAGHVQKTIGEL